MTPPTTLVYLPGKSLAPILPSETVTVEERIDPFPTGMPNNFHAIVGEAL